MVKLKSLSSVLLAFLLAINSGSAATYYVSTAGNNANVGTDSAHPWQTLAFVNGKTFVAGDHILFFTNQTWSGSVLFGSGLTINHGTGGTNMTDAGAITFSSFGTGSQPVFDGGGGSGVISIGVNNVKIDGIDLQNATSQCVSFATRVGTQIVNLTAKNCGLRVFYGGQSLTGTTTVDNIKYSTDSSHATTSNCVEIWSGGNGAFKTSIVQVTNSTWDRSRTSANPAGLAAVCNGCNNALFAFNIVHGGGQGLGVKPFEVSGTTNNGTPKCNTGDPNPNTTGNVITDNFIDGVTRGGTTNIDGELIEMEGCPAQTASATTGRTAHPQYPQTNTTIARNVLHCVTTPLLGDHKGSSDAIGGYVTDDADIYGNVLLGGCQSAIYPESNNPGMVRFNNFSTHMHFHNNTIVADRATGSGDTLHCIGLTGSSTTDARNNIYKGCDQAYSSATSSSFNQDYDVTDPDVAQLSSGTGTVGTHNIIHVKPGFVVDPPVLPNDTKLVSGSVDLTNGVNLGAPYNVFMDPTKTAPPYGQVTLTGSVWQRGAWPVPVVVVPPPATSGKIPVPPRASSRH